MAAATDDLASFLRSADVAYIEHSTPSTVRYIYKITSGLSLVRPVSRCDCECVSLACTRRRSTHMAKNGLRAEVKLSYMASPVVDSIK